MGAEPANTARDAAALVRGVARGDARSAGLHCPHCKVPANIRSSELLEPTVRDVYFVCGLCGCKFKGQLAAQYMITPGEFPDPTVALPLRPVTRRDLRMAIAAAEAEDETDQPGLLNWRPPDGGGAGPETERAPPGG